MRRILFWAAILVLAVLAATFTFKNYKTVQIEYYFGFSWEGSLAVLLLIAVAIGVLIGFVCNLMYVARVKRKMRAAQREARTTSSESASSDLTTLPAR